MQQNEIQPFNLQPLLQFIRAAGAILGVIAIITGLIYATRMFALVYETLYSPETFQTHLEKWILAVGGNQLDIVISGVSYPGARIMAIIILGGGAVLLAWISMGFILAGAKTLSWTLGDREAVKKILVHAFGPAKKDINRPS